MSVDGPLLDAMNRAKAMLRDCDQWRKLADPDNPWDESTAAAHIYFDGLPPPDPGPDHSKAQLIALRPFALMWADTAGSLLLNNVTGGFGCPLPSGSIILQIEMPTPSALADDPPALAADIMRKIGRIARTEDSDNPGLYELSGLAGYLPVNEIRIVGYTRTDAKDAHQLGDAIVAEFQLSWGLEG